jgi:hypothetical protein
MTKHGSPDIQNRERDERVTADALTPEMRKSGASAFDAWYEENADVIHMNGGTGDVQALLTALWDSWKNRT